MTTTTTPSTKQAWTELHAGLHRFLLRRVRDPHVADDLLQDVFLKVHTRLPTLREPKRLHAWIYRVARNAVTDYFRASRADAPLRDALQAPESEENAVAELAPCLRALMERLPVVDREALELTDLGNLTQAQLAIRLGITLSGAKSRVQRARARLKEAVLACCAVYLDATGRITDYVPAARCDCRTEKRGLDMLGSRCG